jgi:hypothetical protein
MTVLLLLAAGASFALWERSIEPAGGGVTFPHPPTNPGRTGLPLLMLLLLG